MRAKQRRRLLQRYFDEHGRIPRAGTGALGLDTSRRRRRRRPGAVASGVRPVRDALNRATEIEIIPLDELKRPRMDVVMTVSGIFRICLRRR